MFYRATVKKILHDEEHDAIEVQVHGLEPEFPDTPKDRFKDIYSLGFENMDVDFDTTKINGKVEYSHNFTVYPLDHAGTTGHGSVKVPEVDDEVMVTYLDDEKTQLYYTWGNKKTENHTKLSSNPKNLNIEFLNKIDKNPVVSTTVKDETGRTYPDHDGKDVTDTGNVETNLENRYRFRILHRSISGSAFVADDNNKMAIMQHNDNYILLKENDRAVHFTKESIANQSKHITQEAHEKIEQFANNNVACSDEYYEIRAPKVYIYTDDFRILPLNESNSTLFVEGEVVASLDVLAPGGRSPCSPVSLKLHTHPEGVPPPDVSSHPGVGADQTKFDNSSLYSNWISRGAEFAKRFYKKLTEK